MGIPFVLAGPSGIGKTTLSRILLDYDKRLRSSISYTTRSPRVGEFDGEHYHFIDEGKFLKMVDSGLFLEWAQVHDCFYGTGRDWVQSTLIESDLLLVLDLNGAAALKAAMGAVTIFLVPSTIESLRTRLSRRGTDSLEVIDRRMGTAERELLRGIVEADYVLVNSSIEGALADIMAIIRVERLRNIDRSSIRQSLMG